LQSILSLGANGKTATDVLREEANERQAKRAESGDANYVSEIIRRTKCEAGSCINKGNNCLVIDSVHFKIGATEFHRWNKAIIADKATLELPPLGVRGTPIGPKGKPTVAINNLTTTTQLPCTPFPAVHPSYFQQYTPYHPAFNPHAYSMYPTAASTPTPNPMNFAVAPFASIPLPSSPIDFTVPKATRNGIEQYIDWLARKDSGEVELEVLMEAKRILLEEYVDLNTLKKMSREDAEYWGIKWGLALRLKRDIKEYLRSDESVATEA
jgi:hypothetical protein